MAELQEVVIEGEPDTFHLSKDGKLICTKYSAPGMEEAERWQLMGRDLCDRCDEVKSHHAHIETILDDVGVDDE